MPLLLNLSAACKEVRDYAAAIAHATTVLELVPLGAPRLPGDLLLSGVLLPPALVQTRAKALYRRGVAQLERGREPALAQADLYEAAILQPGDAGIRAKLALAEAAVTAARAESAALCRKMFSS